MGRKSQLEKFDARMRKARAVDNQIAEQNAKAAQQNDIMKEGEKIMKETTGQSNNVFAVIARDSMEGFIKTWNNSMDNVVKTTIRNETETMRNQIQAMIQDEIKAMVQSELESAVRGVFAGINEAVTNMAPQAPVQPEVAEEPIEFDLSSVSSMGDTLNRALEKYDNLNRVGIVRKEVEDKEFVGELTVELPEEPKERKTPEYKEQRYSKPRILKCGACGEAGHNKRTCPTLVTQ